MSRTGDPRGVAPALHDGGMIGHKGAVVVLRFPVNDFWVDLA
jgi:hypothetical protein